MKQEQVDRIASAMRAGRVNVEAEVQDLMRQGYDRAGAEQRLNEVIPQIREHLFKESVQQQETGEQAKIAGFLVLMVAIIGPVFEIEAMAWYIAACCIAAGLGYFGYRKLAAAGIAGALIVVLVLPLTYEFYLRGRTSYLNIEIVIPIAMALAPAFLVGFIIKTIFYPNNN